jgi:hypothetical protein
MEVTMKKNDKNDLKKVEEYFKLIGINYKKIEETDTKTPDYKIMNENNSIIAYCEVKSVYLTFNEEINGYKHATTSNKLEKDIRRACEQFMAVNPEHQHPNILLWYSHDFQLNRMNLLELIQGHISCGNMRIKDLSAQRARIDKQLHIVDCHIWMQEGSIEPVYKPVIVAKDLKRFNTLVDIIPSLKEFIINRKQE